MTIRCQTIQPSVLVHTPYLTHALCCSAHSLVRTDMTTPAARPSTYHGFARTMESGLLAELVMAASSGVVHSTARPPQRPEVESSSGDPRGGCGDADRGAARSLFASDVLTGRAVTDSMWRGVLRQGLGRLRFLRSRGRDYASPPPERYITFCCCCLCWRTFFLSSPWSWSPKLYSFQDTRSGRRDLPLLTHS